MAEAANNIFKSMDGWWVSGGDQAKVLGQLRGKSAEEIAEIRKSYADHFPGHDLDADIGKNLGKEQLKEAKASLSGNEVDAAVQALRQAKSGTLFGNCDKEQVGKILAGITDPAKRAEVAKQVGPEVLATLDGRDKQLVEAQLAGDKAKENAVKIDDAMHGGLFGGGGFLGMGIGQDKDTVNKALESAGTKEEREKLAAAYAEQTKNSTGKSETLTQTLDKNFSGTEKTVATALMDGDKYKASAAKMKLATEGWLFTDKEAIYKELEKSDKNDPELHKKIVEAYNKEYGQGPKGQGLDAMLSENFSGLDHDKAQMLKDKGKLDDTFAMKYAMHGSWLSTDKELVKKTLEGKDAEQVKALVAQYQKDYQIDLQKELQENTSGRAGFEIGQLMKGEPKTPEERLARAEESYQFERGSGSSAFSRGFMDLFSDKGTLLDSQHARVKELADKAQAGKLTKEDEKRLEELTGYQSMDVKTYQESKDAVANTAATAAAVTAGVIVTVASGGTAAPAAVALASAVAGGGASIATKIAIQGAGYSNEDLRNDLVMTGVSAATGGALGAMGAAGGSLSNFAKGVTSSELGQQLIVAGVSGAAGNAINNVASTSLDPNTWKGANPLGTLAKAGGMGLLTGTASGLASGYVNHAMGQGGAGFSAWKGGVSGGAGSVAGNLVNPEMYHGDSGQLLNKWLSSVVGGTAQGAAAGYQGSLHEGFVKAKTKADADAAAKKKQVKQPQPGDDAAAQNQTPNESQTPTQSDTQAKPPVSETTDPPASHSAAKPGDSPHPDTKAAAKVIETLPEQQAAGITQALPPEEAAKLMQALPKDKAAQISETLPAEAAAKIHGDPAQHAEQLQAIDELRPFAKKREDHETLRSWEEEYGRRQSENPKQPPEQQTSTDSATKPTLSGKTHDDKTAAILTAADVANPEGPKKLPPSPQEVERAVKWAEGKLAKEPQEGHLDRKREAEKFAAGKMSQEEHDNHLLEFSGMDAFVNSEAGKAAGLSSGSTPDQIIQAAHNHLRKLNESNYQRVQSGEAEHPSGVSAERLRLAVEGNSEGDRVPLTYKGKSGDVNDLAGATEQMREFQGGIAGIADRNGITDMQVVQVGSGTTGWKNNPMKLLRHYGLGGSDKQWFKRGAWNPESDTDLAVFSDQAKVGAMQVNNPINADYGIFKTGSPDGKPGFSHTDLGRDLYRYGKAWDQRAYDPKTLAKPENQDGLFDFKLNISNDPFTTPPTMYTGPDRN